MVGNGVTRLGGDPATPGVRGELPGHLEVLAVGRQRKNRDAADQLAVVDELDGPPALG